MNVKTINICISCDDNYAKYAGVVIASILTNANQDDNIDFYILDGGITEEKKEQISSLSSIHNCQINFIKINSETFADYSKVKTHKYISIATYYRLKAPSLLPNIDKIIYLDCDVVVNTSLKELYEIDIKDYLLAGVSDNKKRMVKENPTYVNAGILVFNLEKMRQENTEEEFYNYTKDNVNNITKGDQEIINEVCKGKIKVIDSQWNVQTSNFVNRSDYTTNPKIIHYLSKEKPWKFGSYSYHKKYWFKYLQLTPWAISDEDKKYWYTKNQIASVFGYIKHRPLFFLRPRFYKALFLTYIYPFIKHNKILSIQEYNETHNIIYLFGIKIKHPKLEYLKLKKQNPFYQYKKNNVPITEIPPATGQIRDIQLANLALLKELDYVCRQANIKYWLDYGTLLGAVRHKGYIPWDDDIDVSMMREDYEKIIDAFNKTSRNPDIYAEQTYLGKAQTIIKIKHKGCPHLFVDIFPHDWANRIYSREERITKTKIMADVRRKLNKNKDYNTSEKILEKVLEYNKEIIPDIYIEHSDIQCGIEYSYTEPIWIYSYETIFPIKEIEFEGFKAMIVNKPEEYLTDIFGNYMAYPKKIGFGHSMYLKLSDNEKNIIKNLIGNI